MPDKYYIDNNNNIRLVPDGKEQKFLSKYPGAREASSKELSSFENKRAEMQSSTGRESNIQNEQGSSTAKTSTNQPLIGQNTSFAPNKSNLNIPNYAEEFAKNNPEIGIGPNNTGNNSSLVKPFVGKPLKETITDTMQDMPVSPEAYFDSSVNRYQQDKDWIEQIKNDNTISDSVKQSLINDYQNNIRTSELSVEEKDLPPAAKEWLERNKVSREVTQYNPSMMGGGSYTTTVKENTPEQIAFIKDYVANSAEGKRYAQAHNQWIEGLETEIDPLITQGQQLREKAAKETNKYNREIGVETTLGNFLGDKDVSLTSKAINVLKEAKKRLNANRNGGGFWKGLHFTKEDTAAFATFSEFTNDAYLNQVIDKYEKNPESLSDEEKLAVQAKYIADQITAGVDPGSWYNIGQTTRTSLPFMRDFIVTAPIGGAGAGVVKGGASALAAKTGANLLLSRGIGPLASKLAKGAIDLSVRPAIQSMFSPSSYAMAFEEMQGQAIDRDEQGNISFDNRKSFEHGMTSAFIENQSEVMGEVVLDKLFQKLRIPIPSFLRNKAIQRLHNATGVQGPVTEYLEEKYSDLANIVRGEQTIEGFFDPRSNLETFGAVAIMQIPFSAIQGTGYGIGKVRDLQAKRAIRQTFDKSTNNLNEYFGEDAEQAIAGFNNLVDNSTEEELKEALTSVIEDESIDNNAKRAIVEYVTSYSAYSGLNKAKQEDVSQVEQQVTQAIEENANPQMNAVVSATIAGVEGPMQVVSGNIVQREDGSIDREASDKQIFYVDAEGNKQVTSIDFVENIEENIPIQDAIAQLTEAETANIISQQENEEVREYTPGEIVTADVFGNGVPFTGQITEVTEAGNYIIIGTQSGQRAEIQPRQIINQDNIQGVDNGSLVEYRNEKGETVQGTVNDAYGLRPQGMIDIDGNIVPIADVIGLVEEEEQLPLPPADMMIGENGAVPYNPNVSNSQELAEQNSLSLDQIPKDEKGNILFDQVPVENTISALGEVYETSEIPSVVNATISNIGKQIEKAKSPTPTGDITKDIANKRDASQQIEELNTRLAYWQDVRNAIQQNQERVLSLEEEALSLGATSEQLQDIQTSSDFIDLIEQLQDGQQEQTSNEERSEKQTSTNNSEGNPTESTQRTVGERNRSEENTGDSRQDSHSTGNGINSSPEDTIHDKIAQAESETDTNPTEAQKEAGNYKKGKVTIHGFNISIEQPQGSIRSGVDANGKEWSITMNNTYGYIRGTEGKDRDHIDVFLGNNPESNRVFVVDQVNQDESFDEHKVMLGFDSIEEARKAYLSNYEEGWQGLGNITEVDVDTFRKWTDSDTRRVKPFAEYKEIQETLSDTNIPASDNVTVQNTETTTESSNDIRIVEYSDKSIAVYGNTKEIKDQLKAIGGRFNPKLRDGAGWVFPKSKESDVRALIEEQSTTPVISDTEVSTPAYGTSNTLISADRYEELKKQMRDKLNNLNSGFDPEVFTIGTQMAMYHIEAGARKFADFANKMIEDLGENVRPYLKSFYEGARQMPSMETMRSEMDSFNTVNSFDLDNLSTFEESNTQNTNSNETNSDNRSDNSIAEDGGISTRTTDTNVRERTASTQTDGRTQSEQRPAMEAEDVEQRGRSDRDRGNNAEPSGAELRARGTERSSDTRRKDTGDTEQSGKPLNTNNNRQSREENVVPRGNTAKINANIAAIKLAKRLIETGKKATPEQMNVLRRYTGWGGLSSVFQTNDKNYKALQDLLTEEEYDSARASTTTAFYTPSEVTASVWDMIEKLGFKGGSILEPSAGIGNFFALMPESISNISQLRGVELDAVSGNILKLLYPDANINISGFEKQRIPNNSMDLVVSNVPFGNFKVYDSNNKDISTQFDIHDYFIAKSIRTLKAGGIGVFITTSSTLDKSSALRNWVINNGNADFVDAVRLNTDTFKNDAGTEATADIIIIRKRDVNGISPYAKNMQDSVMEREATYTQQEKDKWGYSTGEVEKKARMVYNKYFLDNPMRMAGEMKFGFEGGNAIRPTEQRLAPVKTINQQEVINQMIDELPSNIYNTTPADKTSKAVANNGTKEGGLTIIDGQPYIVQYNEAVPVDWNSNKAAGYPKEEILQDYLDIKEGIDLLLEAEHNNDANIATYRKNLNKVYDNFVKKYGTLNENRKINFLQDDIDFPSVSAIENIEDGKDGVKTISKSDIFTKRVIDNQIEPKADNVEDAVRVSMNQNGKVDIPYIAQLLDKTNEEVQSEIVSKRIGFVNPETGLVESRNQYLSGNVRDKLSIAQQANQENEYDSNIEELSKVIPADIPINLIKLTLGSTWVSTNVYEDFFKETFDVGAQFTKTSTDKYIGKFSRKDNAKDIQMGMPEASGSTLALNSMNNATTTISMQVWEDGKRKTVTDPLKTAQAAAKQTEIAETFEAWVKQNKKYHEELENIYNNIFNAVVNSTIDVDSFDRFPGVGGKVVSLSSKELENGKELHQYRVAKENTEADNELVAKEAKSLGLKLDSDTGIYSTHLRGDADVFFKKLNGTSKILRQHQKEGVIRGLESATLLAHEVGTGKTLTLITTAMEMRRLGLAKKPTIIVQRSTYKQFVKDIKNQYPNAKVLAPSAKDLTAKQREQLFAKIAYNDWDIIVLYHSYLDSIPDNPQRVAQYIDEKIQEKMDLLAEMERAKEDGAANAGRMMGALKKEIEKLERDRDNTLNPDIEEESDTPTKSKRKRSVKDIEKVRSNTEAKVEKSLDRRTDNTMTFEQLGIDALLIDEAHAYKKLGFVTSLQRVKGIDTAESKRAQSTRLKSSYILENHNGKNIVLATGTPISNTMAEMWTFMRYLYPHTEMGRLQMNNFDAFVNNFGSIEESAEFGSNGKFRITNRFSSYSNVPELIAAWRQVAHTVLTEEVSTLKEGVGTPRVEGGKPADIMLEQTPPLKSVMKAIKNKLEEFDRMSGAEKKENSYIPLVMFGLAKRAAIDVRLVDPNLPDHPDSKLNRTVAEIIQDLKDTLSYKGTIAVFCDSYQSSDKSFNVFREIKQKLIDSGIPAEQVAIINDFDKDEAKERLFTSVNNGDIRVVMGTTEKLGVGVNIQERLHMAVHMDAPLRPSDYQQRNGRIIRQGNTHLNMDKTIKILRVGVQKTLDVTGYQRLEIKKKFIDQIMKGDVSQRMLEEADIESTDSSNFNQMMANLSGSQAALALSIEQNKLKKLQNARQYHADNQVFMAGAVRRAKGVIVGNGQAIERFEDYKKELNKLFPEGKVTTVSIGKISANTPEDIDALLSKYITKRIDKEAADLREDFLRDNSIIKTSIFLNGIKIDLEIEVKRNYDVDSKKTRITREIQYTTPNNSIENPHSIKNEVIPLFDSKAGANVQNVIDEINDLLSGYDIDREIQRYKLGIDKSQRDIDAYEPQIGQPFAKENELRATEEKVEDLNAQMEVELKQIEEAEAKEDVEAIDINGIVEKNTDDNPEDDPTPPSGGRRQTSSSGNFQSIPAEKFDRLVDKLTQTGLAVDVVLNDDIRNNPELQDAEGNVYGYVTPEGVVHLDATRMNANTPIHEFGHLWNSFTKKNDTALYNRGVELIKQSPYWERVNNNTDYASLSEEQKADEALAMAIGDKGELISNRNLKQQFVDWMSEVWQSIKRAFGINTNVSLADMTLSDFTDRAVQDLLRGERLTDTSVQSEEKRMQSVNDLADATNSTMTEEVRNQLDSRIKNFRFRIREAWEDRHLAVKEFLDTLRKNGVDIAEYNDYYKQATHINGKIDAQLEHYNEKFQKPLNKAISDFEKAGFDYREIENYAILKHGLERNEWMRQDAINQYKVNNPDATQEQIDKYAESLPDDYSGITAVQEEVGMSAEEFITEFENKAGKKLTDNFWKKVKDTTQYSISKQLEGGLIDKKTFDDLTSRYDYYIPLRGHDAEVAEDRWDYSPNMGTYFVAPLIKAKGRKTRSESPFAYIFSMAQSSINSANRNWLNQTMLRLARKDTKGLMGVSQSWYVMDGMNADGVPTYTVQSPTFSENAEQYRKNIEEFEERMQKLAEQSFAYPSGSKLNIGGLFIKRNQADQHVIHVWQNGKEYTVYINANPAVARAINGTNAKDLHKDLQFIAKVSRQMAANFTTRNPIFVATNFSRDYIFASFILPVKEDAKYGVQFQRNIPRSAGALQRYIRGKADLSKKQDQYVIEYIMNGAKTGFSHIVELDKIQKRIEREIKKGESKNVFRSFLDVLEGCNEFAENLSRLSVYITSREQGRSITQSISDAKEVTVNFNRSGTGTASGTGFGAFITGASGVFRSLYLFVNAGIQALSNFAKVAQKNKGKTVLLISSYAMTGFLMPMLTAMIGGDDGLDEYMKLSDWERQNNLCIYTGNGFIKIPLPHELRVFHAMGDNIYQAAFGRKDTTETLLDVIMSFSDLIPANPMGAIQGSWADIMPDATKPFFQLQANKNFTGSRIVNEWADPNKPGYLRVRTNKKGEPYAPAFLVKLGESLDAATGGDGVEKGLVSFNPDEVNHILRGYFGGLYTIGTQVVTIGDKIYELADTGEFKLKARETPLKTFYTSADDLMTTSSGLNSKYFKISDDMQEIQRKIKGYQDQALNGDLTTEAFAAKIEKFTPDIEKYKRIYPFMKRIKKYETALKDLDGEDQKEAERIIADMKKQVIEINSIK